MVIFKFYYNNTCELIGNIAKALENNKYTIGVSLDLSKAFDTLNHSILLQKMERYGIRGLAQAWFASYLKNRKMRSKCTPESTGKVEYSSYYQVDHGTPQGSCLGPLLFIIFTNDFHLTIKNANSLLFADDTTLYQSHRKLSYLKWMMEEELKCTMDWFRANQLTLNLSKTVCILFSHNPKITSIELNLDTIQLTSVEYTKFLGMWVDRYLNWKKHINIVLTKIKQNTNMLKVSSNFLNTHVKKMIYHSHILSHVKNGLFLWGNMMDNTTLDKVQRCLNKCYKLITHKDSSLSNMKSDGFHTLKDLLRIENCKLSYRHQHLHLPTNVHSLIGTDSSNKPLSKNHNYNTRYKKDLNIPQAKYKSYHTSYLCKALSDYTQIPVSIKNTNTIGSFVRQLKKYLLTLH